MTVYVDDAYIPARVGRYSSRWCHLFTDQDDPTELHELAQRIGLRRAWFQPGKATGGAPDPTKDHYDVTEGKRREAIAVGAVEIDAFDAATMRDQRRAARLAAGTEGERHG